MAIKHNDNVCCLATLFNIRYNVNLERRRFVCPEQDFCIWKMKICTCKQGRIYTHNYFLLNNSAHFFGWYLDRAIIWWCYMLEYDAVQWLIWWIHPFNTLGPRQNGRHFPDDIFKCIFLNENVRVSIKISLKIVPMVQSTLFQNWLRQWLGAGQATSHCLSQWWLVYWRIYASHGRNELTLLKPSSKLQDYHTY